MILSRICGSQNIPSAHNARTTADKTIIITANGPTGAAKTTPPLAATGAAPGVPAGPGVVAGVAAALVGSVVAPAAVLEAPRDDSAPAAAMARVFVAGPEARLLAEGPANLVQAPTTSEL
jgi:hypothetical protein